MWLLFGAQPHAPTPVMSGKSPTAPQQLALPMLPPVDAQSDARSAEPAEPTAEPAGTAAEPAEPAGAAADPAEPAGAAAEPTGVATAGIGACFVRHAPSVPASRP